MYLILMQHYPFDFGSPEYHLSYYLRDKILRQPLNLSFTPEQLESEFDSIHLGSFDHFGNMHGCMVLLPLSDTTIKMRQVAVSESRQGTGIGRGLVAYSERYAANLAYKKIVLHARDTAIPFYKKLGYTIIGEAFSEVNILHRKMEKDL